ncbi:MAG TPA: hypothetical protein K8U86_05815 [Brevibacterium ravenspurgense]|nr:hypothetical protein [Brevibacterium ravenspurgense]
MGKPIKNPDLLLAGQLAELLGAVGDIRIAGRNPAGQICAVMQTHALMRCNNA